ncbi:MAG: gamma-glutamyltransferase [Candidatus Rariloculaceae bacterium]
MDRPLHQKHATRSVVMATHGIAATSHPLATQIAIQLLRQGGSAVDAAIGANAALGLMEPTGAGVGGDLFAIVWDAKLGCLRGLNASGRSPLHLTLDQLHELGLKKIPTYGPLSVSVPGAVDGWSELHAEFGKLEFCELFAPAIDYAEQGFPVTEVIANEWAASAELFSEFPGFAKVFMLDGRAPIAGELFKNPRLAETYRVIAEGGRRAFYEGDIAAEIEAYMRANGGYLRAQDFTEHTSEWVEPVSTNYRGYDIWELPPNGQGIAVLQMLNLLEEYDLASLGWESPEYLHLLIEAKKLAYEDRAYFYADPSFVDVPVSELISKDYAKTRRELIDPQRASRELSYGDPSVLQRGDTVYLTVADQDGYMISLIQSNYCGMGSGMTPSRLGFALQNRGELFSLNPVHPNVYEPGKRPFHTIIPAFVTCRGEPLMSFGVMGADMQPQGQVQVLLNHIDFGMNIQEAGDAPRIRHDGSSTPIGERMSDGGLVYLESGHAASTLVALEEKGHTTGRTGAGYGGYQAIRWDAERLVYQGASESRKDGYAAGY